MMRLKDVVLWDLLGDEADNGRIPIKRKAISLDFQTCLKCVAEENLGVHSGAISVPAEKKQKILVDEAEENSSHGVLLSGELFGEIAEPKSHDIANSFRENGRNHISNYHVQESTSGGDSTVTSHSEDTENEESALSPISSRSSYSRQNSQIELPPHAITPVSVRDNVQILGNVIDQRGSNGFLGHSSSLDIWPLTNNHASQALVSIKDGIQTKYPEGVKCSNGESIKSSNNDDSLVDRQSPRENLETSNKPNRLVASIANGDPCIENDNFCQSLRSSVTSNTRAQSGAINAPRHDILESWIKSEILGSDPDFAELVYLKAKDQLEYVTPDDIEESQGTHALSLLQLVELEIFGLAQASEGFKKYVANSSLGTSHPTAMLDFGQSAVLSSSSSASQRGSSKVTPLPNGGLIQQTKPQKGNVKSTMTESSKARRFRCLHNSLYPSIFCADQETPEKFRTCAGPGWRKMQHCQEHMYKYHLKQVQKPKPLQCGVCLDEFSDVEELRSHTESVDCPPRCLDCNEEFPSKSLRLEHQKLSHFEENAEGPYMELDEKKRKEIKEALKALKSYSELLKKGRCDPKPELEDWIKANHVLYEDGRSDEEKAKARMELGYWYTIYTTLAPQTEILEHPFYDATTIPHVDMASEKILLMNDIVVESRIELYGPPPTDPDRQRKCYRDSLQDALQIAARTTRKITHTQSSVSAVPPSMSQSARDPVSNSQQRSLTSDFLFLNGRSTVASSPKISNGFSDIGVSQDSYVSSAQTVSAMTRDPSSLSDSSMIGMGMSMNQDSCYNTNNLSPGDFENHYSNIW